MARLGSAATTTLVALVALVVGACGGPAPSPTTGASTSTSSTSSMSSTPSSSPAGAAVPAAAFSPWSITRVGRGLTISGALPDEETRAGLVGVLGQVLPGAALKDDLVVRPGVRSPDAAGLGALFDAIAKIPDFALTLDGHTLTLTGTAPAEVDQAGAVQNAKAAFPDVEVVDHIAVGAGSASCTTLRDDAVFHAPITFASDGATLSADARRTAARIAERVKPCASTKLVVVGYTDATGGDAINLPLSRARAKAVADQLISDGIAAADVTFSGAGATKPVASDTTPDGRARNRRVEVSAP